ncbi:MAG: hypothetical protein Q7T77_07105 [Sulfuricurvum sp.]|nr:hypothetical protein [Sulfuricurvum sp.]
MNEAKLKKIVTQLLRDLKAFKRLRDFTINIIVNEAQNKDSSISDLTDDTGLDEETNLKIASGDNEELYAYNSLYILIYESMLDNVISLNKLLEKPNKKLLEIDQIRQKEFITVKEFEILFGYSSQWQAQRRSKLHDPLPRATENKRKILYNTEEVRKWIENNVLRQ